jgi:DNA polymerase I
MYDTLLLVDYNSIFRRAMEVKSSLSFKGKPTHGVYGFIQQFCEHINAVKPDFIIVCSDSKPYERSNLLPDYKKHHKKVTDPKEIEYHRFNRDKVDELLLLLQIPVWKENGLEADDLIAICCNQFLKKFDQIVIASSDSDLFQLFKYPGVFLRKKIKEKFVLYSREHFKKDFQGITSKQYIRYLSMLGTHNAVPGIEGLGKVKAMIATKDEELYKQIYSQHKQELDLYQKMIQLPLRDTVSKFPKLKRGIYPGRKVINLLDTVGIELTQQMNNAFKTFETF